MYFYNIYFSSARLNVNHGNWFTDAQGRVIAFKEFIVQQQWEGKNIINNIRGHDVYLQWDTFRIRGEDFWLGPSGRTLGNRWHLDGILQEELVSGNDKEVLFHSEQKKREGETIDKGKCGFRGIVDFD